MTARARHSYVFASHDVLGLDRAAIDVFAGIIVRTNRGAFQGNSRKHAATARIAENLSAHPGIGIRRSITSFGASGNRSVGAELNLAAQDGFHAAAVHNEED